mmetsp:Transcript_2358/g.4046  ORF Transcript_2358/g.4046 Transcript_2358/m.4046 type:complete len:99 (+) Transcript_2358:76-372(+)
MHYTNEIYQTSICIILISPFSQLISSAQSLCPILSAHTQHHQPNKYQSVNKIQAATTPLTTRSSCCLFFRILSINPFNPGIFPAIVAIVPPTPLKLAP